jgi:hypothetical protein
MTNKELTIFDGINIQNDHLTYWRKILKPEIYSTLEKWAKSTNNEAKSGYDIRRGDNLTNWIVNEFKDVTIEECEEKLFMSYIKR